jgi:hypothetical protein
MIDTLPLLTPDPKRSARVATRCSELLDKRAAQTARSARDAAQSRRIERDLTAGICALYLSSVVVIALRVFGAF